MNFLYLLFRVRYNIKKFIQNYIKNAIVVSFLREKFLEEKKKIELLNFIFNISSKYFFFGQGIKILLGNNLLKN